MENEDWVVSMEEGKASVKELDRPQVPMRPSIADWVTRIQEEAHGELGDSQSHSQQPLCIYRVPVWLKDLYAGAYEPRVVSLGPYHYGNPKLKPMEKHKHRAFLTFLRRAKEKKLINETEPLAAITVAMTAVVEQLKSSYEGLDDLSYLPRTEAEAIEPLAALDKTMKAVLEQLKKSDKGHDDRNRYIDDDTKERQLLEDRFLQLMIVDGCFILEVLRVATTWGKKEGTGYESTDPVFSEHGQDYMMNRLRRDMLLLENQLPMLALTTLAAQIGLKKEQLIEQIRTFYDLTDIRSSTSSDMHENIQKKQLIKQIRTFFCGRLTNINNSSSLDDDTQKSSKTNDDSMHVLHEYIKCMTQFGAYSPTIPNMKWSATELDEGGVKFSKSVSCSFKDISFDTSKGILSLPRIVVGDCTESNLLNLMIFEELHVGAGNAVTAYVNLMDTLIDSARDVELLRTKDIVKGWVGSDKNVAKIFNRIAQETAMFSETGDENGVDDQLWHYRETKINRWRASFIHTYLRNPWVFFSLLGALILLFLTVLQDVYTVLPYYSN